jgi:hypothetical protein
MANDTELRLGFKADIAEVNAATRSLQTYKAEYQNVQKAAADFTRTEQQVNQALADTAKVASGDFSAKLEKAFKLMREQALDANKEIQRLRDSLKETADTASNAPKARFGRVIGQVGGLTNAIGDQGLGKVVQEAGKFTQITETFSAISEAAAAAGVSMGAFLLSIVPIAAIAGAGGLALKVLGDTIKENDERVKHFAESLKAQSDAELQATELKRKASKAEIEDAIARDKAALATVQAEKAAREAATKAAIEQADAIIKAAEKEDNAIKGVAAEIAKNNLINGVKEGMDDLNKKEADLTASIKRNTEEVLPAVAARENETTAIKANSDALIASADNAYQAAVKTQQLQGLTKEQAEKQQEQLNVQIKGTLDALNVLESSGDKSDAVQAKIKAYNDQLDKLGSEYSQITDLLNQNVLASEAEKKARQDSIAVAKKYREDIQNIENQADSAGKASAQKYSDTVVQIAEQATKAAEDSLRKLQEKQADLATSFAQGESDARRKAQQDALDAQIKFQRTEANEAKNHERDLQKIRKDAADKEQDLILNRDFAGLFQLKRDTAKQIDESNSNYVQQRQDRLEAFKQEQGDRQQQFAQEEQARIENYQRQLAAAQIAYQREQEQAARNRRDALVKAQQQYNQELTLINQKYTQELKARQAAAIQELQIIAQGDSAKLALEAQYYAASQQLLKNAIAGVSGGYTGKSSSLSNAGGANAANNVNNNTHQIVVNQSIQGGSDPAVIASVAAQKAILTIKQVLGL